MNGILRIGHITGTSKIILNAVSSTKDFYVNGDSQVLGNLTVSSLDSTGYINVQSIQTNTFNALNTNDIFFNQTIHHMLNLITLMTVLGLSKI
jgi:hypothetical protein